MHLLKFLGMGFMNRKGQIISYLCHAVQCLPQAFQAQKSAVLDLLKVAELHLIFSFESKYYSQYFFFLKGPAAKIRIHSKSHIPWSKGLNITIRILCYRWMTHWSSQMMKFVKNQANLVIIMYPTQDCPNSRKVNICRLDMSLRFSLIFTLQSVCSGLNMNSV